MSDNQPPQPPPSSTNNTSSNTATTAASPSSANQNTINPQNENANSSLPSRLQSSATTLAQNLFTPSPADIARNLQPGGSSSNKAAPPSSVAAASAAQTFHGETTVPGSSVGRGISRHGDVGGSFRSATGSATGQDGLMEEAYQFQNDQAYQDGGLESGVSPYEQDAIADIKGKGKGKASEKEYEQDYQPFENTWQSITATHSEPQSAYQNAQDGSELLTLLTSPSFNPEFPELITTTDNLDPALVPNDLSDPSPFPLSAQEIQTLESFRRKLGSHPTQGQRRINPTSLIPDIDNFLSTVPAQTQNDATALRDAVLTGLPGAEEWMAVEEKYQDEVWGFLKPVLEEARREMEEKEENGGDMEKGREEDGPAVARLKMILRHMGA